MSRITIIITGGDVNDAFVLSVLNAYPQKRIIGVDKGLEVIYRNKVLPDYIVGDFGYDQLRLKGFYKDSNKKAELSKRFSTIQDYLLEYCNFGCPYFILRKVPESEIKSRIETEDENAEIPFEENKLQDVKIQPTIQDTEH